MGVDRRRVGAILQRLEGVYSFSDADHSDLVTVVSEIEELIREEVDARGADVNDVREYCQRELFDQVALLAERVRALEPA